MTCTERARITQTTAAPGIGTFRLGAGRRGHNPKTTCGVPLIGRGAAGQTYERVT